MSWGNRGQITISAHQLRQIGINISQTDAGLQANQIEILVRLRQPLVRPAAIVAARVPVGVQYVLVQQQVFPLVGEQLLARVDAFGY